MATADEFAQLALLFTDPIQEDYEVIRPVVLFAETVAARSRQTALDRATVGEKARRFMQRGMLGLGPQRTPSGHSGLPFPDAVAGYILYLKQLYPPLHYREIVRIVQRKYGCTTNHHTVKRFLDEHALPVQLPLPVTGYHQFDDAYRARWTVVRMSYEGWHQQSIAGCLKLSRKHVGHILEAFARDGFAGLEDQRTRPPAHPANQLALPFLKEVLDVQREYPRAGRFRVRGLLERRTTSPPPSEATVGRAMAINRQSHGAPPAWTTDRADDTGPDGIVKYLPYEPTHRHRYWFLDIRYLVQVGDDAHWTYSICVIEGYSRKILAGMASEYQDTVAVVQLLAAALAEYGRPEGIVSDNGAVFTSAIYEGLLEDVDVEVCHIEKGKPWQNLIEAQFKVQLRLADAKFEQATTLAEVQEQHAAFVETFNTTPHWAHQEREDGLRMPVEVLGWMLGRRLDPGQLQQALRQMQVERVVNRIGYVSIQRFYIYAERGLARQRVSLWLYDGSLRIAYQQTLLAQYAYRADRRARRLRAVDHPQLYPTLYASPQLELWELDDTQWRKVLERPVRRRRRQDAVNADIEQLTLPITVLLMLLVASAIG